MPRCTFPRSHSCRIALNQVVLLLDYPPLAGRYLQGRACRCRCHVFHPLLLVLLLLVLFTTELGGAVQVLAASLDQPDVKRALTLHHDLVIVAARTATSDCTTLILIANTSARGRLLLLLQILAIVVLVMTTARAEIASVLWATSTIVEPLLLLFLSRLHCRDLGSRVRDDWRVQQGSRRLV